jgi:hypothetical protein
VIVFNRSHLRLFASDPLYRDIFTYINSFAPDWIANEEIAEALGIEPARARSMIAQLADLGVIVCAAGRSRAAKRNFYYPDDLDFFALRNENFLRNAERVLKRLSHEELEGRRAYRGLITRELTAEQMDELVARADDLIRAVASLPESDRPERIYSLCVLAGESFRRPAVREGVPALPARPIQTSSLDSPQPTA